MRLRGTKKAFFIWQILVLAGASNLLGQSSTKFQIWTDFNPKVQLNEQFKIVGDIGYRIQPENNAQSFLVRGALRYSPNRIVSIDLGLAEFILWNTDRVNSAEFRSFQFLLVNWPTIGKFKFQHRIGVEQRWFNLTDTNTKEFVHRARYRIGVRSPNFSLLGSVMPFYMTANAEFLRDINSDELSALVDGDRFMVGMGGVVSQKLSAELQFQIMAFNDPDLNKFIRNIDLIRIRVFYQFR